MSTLGKTGKIVTRDNFCDKFNNYILNNFIHVEDVVCIASDMEYPTTAFKEIHMPAYLSEEEEKRNSKQIMWEINMYTIMIG